MTTDARAAGTFTIRGQLEVVRLGFGAMRITGHGIWGPPRDHDEAIRVLRRADELGINLIDTADSYGPGVSEELIAEALHPYPEGLVVATKAGFARPGPGRWVEDGRPEHLREAVEGSLARLRLERIDLLQLHRIDPKVPADDQLGTLKELQERGQIRFIGLSEVSVDQLEHARTIVDVVTVQNRYNVTNRTSETVLERCEELGIGFMPFSPLMVGKLAGPGGPLDAIARRLGAMPSQVALAWLLRRSPAMLPIPGTSSVAHLEENVAAAGVELTDDDMTALAAAA
ncbi:MAG TPA: aldo/keto reductase [Actinomycetota bacterium]|jgi:pyridoxine 4-dehydrogenase|nr:aldo/keto reductase [Actinomycetota bacterium]